MINVRVPKGMKAQVPKYTRNLISQDVNNVSTNVRHEEDTRHVCLRHILLSNSKR